MKNGVYRIILMGFISVVVFLMLFSLVFSNKKLVSSVTSNVNNAMAKVDLVVSVPFIFFTKTQESVSDFMSTYSENSDLKRSVADLENQSILISNLQDENNALKAALNISEDFKQEKVITSNVFARTSVSWLSVLTVNSGENNGVRKSMVATSNGGVIGFVSNVSGSTSSISLLSDSKGENTIAASIPSSSDSSVFGIISMYDQNRKLLEMTQLNADTELPVGSEVVTSGLDSVAVKNVPIGTVVSVLNDEGERTVLVKPYADFDDISYVTLIGSGK